MSLLLSTGSKGVSFLPSNPTPNLFEGGVQELKLSTVDEVALLADVDPAVPAVLFAAEDPLAIEQPILLEAAANGIPLIIDGRDGCKVGLNTKDGVEILKANRHRAELAITPLDRQNFRPPD